jgi:hypothetical protein
MDLFIWGYPTTDCAEYPSGDGRCDNHLYNAFEHGHSDWKRSVLTHASWPHGYNVRFDGNNVFYMLQGQLIPVAALSFVLSKSWAGAEAPGVFMRLVRKHNIHIIDGLQGKTRKSKKHD